MSINIESKTDWLQNLYLVMNTRPELSWEFSFKLACMVSFH